MAKINPYNPGELPNRLVGTPGVDPSAGRGAQSIADGLIQARNETSAEANNLSNAYSSLASRKAGLLGEAVGAGGVLAGEMVKHHYAAVRQTQQATLHQQQQIADLGVVAAGHGFAQDAQSTLDGFIGQHRDDPESIPGLVQKHLNDNKAAALKDYTDPLLRAKAEANFDGTITSVMDKAQSKSMDMQHAQATVMAPNMMTAAQNSIEQQTGSIDERNASFAAQVQIMSNGIKGMQPQLGKAVTEEYLNQGYVKAVTAHMNNLIDQRPDDPTAALQHLTQVGNMLQGSATMNAALTGGQRHEFAGRIDAARAHELKEVKNVEVANQANFETTLGARRVELDLHHDNPELQTQALQWAQKAALNLKGRVEQVNRDPNLPEDAKTIQRESAVEQGKTIDSIVRVAHANLQYQNQLQKAKEADDRHDAVEARRIAHEAKVEWNAQQKRQKDDAKDLLKKNEYETKAAINDKLDELGNLAVEPTKNRDKLIKLQAEIGFLAKNARDAGYLDPDKAQSYTEKVNKIGLAAAQYKDQSALFGFFGTPTTVKIKKANEQLKAKAAYEAGVAKTRASLMAARTADARAELLNITSRGQEVYRDRFARIQASDLPSDTKTLRTNQLMSWVLQKYPSHKPPRQAVPPTAKQLSSAGEPHTLPVSNSPVAKGFVAPPAAKTGDILTAEKPEGYNGTIDVTKRTLVLHPGGHLDAGNSTEAARKEYGEADGDYGTEYSMREQYQGHEYSFPTIYDGKLHSRAEAFDHFKKTGKYLGKWPVGTPKKVMNDYENRVHSRVQYLNGVVYRGPNG